VAADAFIQSLTLRLPADVRLGGARLQVHHSEGTPSCRGTVSGRDWQRPDTQRKYGSYFSTSYLLRRLSHQPDHRRDAG
jgi:hypothetical protein